MGHHHNTKVRAAISRVALYIAACNQILPPSLPPSLDAQQYPSNGAVGGFQPEESDDYPDMQGKEDGTLQFDEQYQGDYQCE